jgi:hypothetical protein
VPFNGHKAVHQFAIGPLSGLASVSMGRAERR